VVFAMQTNSSLRSEMGFEQRFTPSQIKGAIFFGGFYLINCWHLRNIFKFWFPFCCTSITMHKHLNSWELTNSSLRSEMGFEQRFTPSQIKGAIFFGGFYDMKTVRETA
jgi:hypothetical protein